MSVRPPLSSAKKIAKERIEVLFVRAAEFFPSDPAISNRCVELARRISMRHRVRIDRRLKRQFCRHCHCFLVPGRNMRVRIHRGKVIITCRCCGRQMRIPVGGGHHGSRS